MKLKATKLLTLRLPTYTHVHITLAGCGGTGSHVASGLVSIGQALAAKGTNWSAHFVDPDRVEQKNVGRQLFSQADIGQPKATALANRLNAALGVTIAASVRAISTQDTFQHPGDQALNIVVGAVDSPAARAIIAAKVAKAAGRLWWLDCGNENHSGQVLIGNTADKKKLQPALGFIDALPAPTLVYPDLAVAPKAKKAKPAASCAELAAAGEQGLMVNRMAAAWALACLHDLLLGQLRWFGLAFDLEWGGVRTWALDEATLKGL